jgi:hypothetical protein
MNLWGADLLVVLLILAALYCSARAWIASFGHGRAIRDIATWLERHRAEAWADLPWAARRLLPQGGVQAMKRRGLAEDAHFQTLDARAKRLNRQFVLWIFASLSAIGLVFAGTTYLGWVM